MIDTASDRIGETGTAREVGTWRELFANHLGTSIVLAGGVALYATNEFLTVSLLPSAISEIGGSRLYAWVTTLYLVGSVISATTVNAMLTRVGARSSFLTALGIFGVASLMCASAPSIGVLIAGRAFQGVAGGLLAGLSYALINATLPRSLWTRGPALVSAMWGVATLLGPAMGGVFAQLGLWRWAFGAMVVLTALMALLVRSVLPVGEADRSDETPVTKVPVWSLLLVGIAALSISVAQLPHYFSATAGLLAAGALIVGVFVVVDMRMHAAVLPPSVFGRGPLKWIYLTIALQIVAVMLGTYVPLFGQRLGHLTPVGAGFLGAVLAFGWTIAELVSASLTDKRIVSGVIASAPLVMAAGLGLAAVTQRDNAPISTVVLWGLGLLVSGIGIGMAWPHLSMRAMSSVKDAAEGGAAAAAINTVQLIAAAFGAGVAGVVVNTTKGGDVIAARSLYTTFVALAALGFFASYNAIFRHRLAAGMA